MVDLSNRKSYPNSSENEPHRSNLEYKFSSTGDTEDPIFTRIPTMWGIDADAHTSKELYTWAVRNEISSS